MSTVFNHIFTPPAHIIKVLLYTICELRKIIPATIDRYNI